MIFVSLQTHLRRFQTVSTQFRHIQRCFLFLMDIKTSINRQEKFVCNIFTICDNMRQAFWQILRIAAKLTDHSDGKKCKFVKNCNHLNEKKFPSRGKNSILPRNSKHNTYFGLECTREHLKYNNFFKILLIFYEFIRHGKKNWLQHYIRKKS